MKFKIGSFYHITLKEDDQELYTHYPEGGYHGVVNDFDDEHVWLTSFRSDYDGKIIFGVQDRLMIISINEAIDLSMEEEPDSMEEKSDLNIKSCSDCRFYHYLRCYVDPPRVIVINNEVVSERPKVDPFNTACHRGEKSV